MVVAAIACSLHILSINNFKGEQELKNLLFPNHIKKTLHMLKGQQGLVKDQNIWIRLDFIILLKCLYRQKT